MSYNTTVTKSHNHISMCRKLSYSYVAICTKILTDFEFDEYLAIYQSISPAIAMLLNMKKETHNQFVKEIND